MYKYAFLLLIFFSILSCQSRYVYHLSDYSTNTIIIDDDIKNKDSTYYKIINPYKSSLHETMNKKVAEALGDFSKAKPASSLGNLVADATRFMATEYLNQPIDIGIVNYGGIRIPSLKKGKITLGNIFELMPFDNFLVVVEVSGQELATIISRIALYGGWPVSGISFKINKDKKPTDVLVNGVPIDFNKSYSIALSDYIANGGDRMDMLIDLKQVNTGKLLREAFIDYFRNKKELVPILEERILKE